MRGNRVGGNWLMKWDEVKKKNPLYSHRLTHRNGVTSELHHSYFHSMTITQAIPKIAEVTRPGFQISEEVAEAWRRVHITAWEFEGNIRLKNWTEEDKQFSWRGSRRGVVGKPAHRRVDSRAPVEQPWRTRKTKLTAITLGSKYLSYVRSPAPCHSQTLSKPFQTLAIKWEVNMFIKKSSFVFISASVIPACIFIIVSLWCCRWQYNTSHRLEVRVRQHVPRGILNSDRSTSGHSQAMDTAIGEHLLTTNSCRTNYQDDWFSVLHRVRSEIHFNILEVI